MSQHNFQAWRDISVRHGMDRFVILPPLKNNADTVWQVQVIIRRRAVVGYWPLELRQWTNYGRMRSGKFTRLKKDRPETFQRVRVGAAGVSERERTLWWITEHRGNNGLAVFERYTPIEQARFDMVRFRSFMEAMHESHAAGRGFIAEPLMDWLVEETDLDRFFNGPGWLPKTWGEMRERERQAIEKPNATEALDHTIADSIVGDAQTDTTDEGDRWR